MPNAPLTPDSLAQIGSGKYAVSPNVMSAIRSAATSTGARFETLLASAAIESGFNSSAKAPTSSATGLFQFVDQTWLQAIKRSGAQHGLGAQAAAIVQRGNRLSVDDPAMRQEILDLRKDPTISAAMAGDHLRDLSGQLTNNLGHAPSVTETYLGHFLGVGGATQMLRALRDTPMASAADVLPSAARANPSLFDGRTVAQFVSKVDGRVGQVYADLGLQKPQGSVQFASAAAPGPMTGMAEGSDGWGAGTPDKLSTMPERMMLSSLSQVFTRMDRMMNNDRDKGGQPGQTPYGVVSALGVTAGAHSPVD